MSKIGAAKYGALLPLEHVEMKFAAGMFGASFCTGTIINQLFEDFYMGSVSAIVFMFWAELCSSLFLRVDGVVPKANRNHQRVARRVSPWRTIICCSLFLFHLRIHM